MAEAARGLEHRKAEEHAAEHTDRVGLRALVEPIAVQD